MAAILDKQTLTSMRTLVIGLGRTGESVMRYLQRIGAPFEVADEKIDPARQEELAANFSDVRVHSVFAESLFAEFDLLILSPGVPLALDSIKAARRNGVRIASDVEIFSAQSDASLIAVTGSCLLYTSPSPRDATLSRMPSSA